MTPKWHPKPLQEPPKCHPKMHLIFDHLFKSFLNEFLLILTSKNHPKFITNSIRKRSHNHPNTMTTKSQKTIKNIELSPNLLISAMTNPPQNQSKIYSKPNQNHFSKRHNKMISFPPHLAPPNPPKNPPKIHPKSIPTPSKTIQHITSHHMTTHHMTSHHHELQNVTICPDDTFSPLGSPPPWPPPFST